LTSTGDRVRALLAVLTLTASWACSSEQVADSKSDFTHGYADSDGVNIHYATAGSGPLVVMIHGFPDYWYTWRKQMAGLQDKFQVVAIDQRGYNRSDSPAGEDNYAMSFLVADVAAVIRHFGQEKAIIVGHDWGGVVAWSFAFANPEMVGKLVVLNLPHPNSWIQSWSDNPDALAGTGYARAFVEGTPETPEVFFGYPMTPQTLSGWVSDEAATPKYVEAFERSDFNAMLAYYKQNYPRNWEADFQPGPMAPQLNVSTLVFHGLDDKALHSDGLNNTWDWIDADLTMVTVPGAGHFVQQDAADLVTSTMRWWLLARSP